MLNFHLNIYGIKSDTAQQKWLLSIFNPRKKNTVIVPASRKCYSLSTPAVAWMAQGPAQRLGNAVTRSGTTEGM